MAEALGYAHRQGVIHRDVKPANVLIGRDGDALLADFGIAKIYEDTLQLTGEGNMVGTPAYMAPEQLQGKRVDARTDIYALGVVLYQALTGECPFVAETPLAVAMMHIHNPLRPPRQLNPDIPEPIERVILRAMAKNPADRFQTAGEMAEALRAALAARQSVAAAPATQALPPFAPPTPPSATRFPQPRRRGCGRAAARRRANVVACRRGPGRPGVGRGAGVQPDARPGRQWHGGRARASRRSGDKRAAGRCSPGARYRHAPARPERRRGRAGDAQARAGGPSR